jgi:hypothetical protein
MTLLKKTAIAILAATTFAQASTALSGVEIGYNGNTGLAAIGYTKKFGNMEAGVNFSADEKTQHGDFWQYNYGYHIGYVYPVSKGLEGSIGLTGSYGDYSNDANAAAEEYDASPKTNGLYVGFSSDQDSGQIYGRLMVFGQETDSHGHDEDTYLEKVEFGFRF